MDRQSYAMAWLFFMLLGGLGLIDGLINLRKWSRKDGVWVLLPILFLASCGLCLIGFALVNTQNFLAG